MRLHALLGFGAYAMFLIPTGEYRTALRASFIHVLSFLFVNCITYQWTVVLLVINARSDTIRTLSSGADVTEVVVTRTFTLTIYRCRVSTKLRCSEVAVTCPSQLAHATNPSIH